jgi:hypothetical protein
MSRREKIWETRGSEVKLEEEEHILPLVLGCGEYDENKTGEKSKEGGRCKLKLDFIFSHHRLPPSEVLMTVDRGSDFTKKEQEKLDLYAAQASGGQGHSLWRYRERKEGTTRAVNIYRGQERG